MRKLSLLVLLSILTIGLTLTSCSKKDNNKNQQNTGKPNTEEPKEEEPKKEEPKEEEPKEEEPKEEEPNPAVITGLLLGKWNIDKKIVFSKTGEVEQVIEHTHECSTIKDYYIFTEDGIGKEMRYNNACTEASLYYQYNVKQTGSKYTYTVEGSTNSEHEISEISENKMTVYRSLGKDKGFFLIEFSR